MKRVVCALLVACQTSQTDPGKPAVDADAGPAELAPKDTSVAKAPPALRQPHPAVPPLPDLPALQNHEAAQPVPLEAKLAVVAGKCKGVWNGSTVVARSCARAALTGTNNSGATPLITHTTLRGGPKVTSVLPAVVDHRAEGTEGPVRNQTVVPACTAFAEAAALDHAILRWAPKQAPVSVMQVWSRYHTAIEENAVGANVAQPFGADTDWPFAVNEAMSWLPCDQADNPKKYGCGQPVNPAHGAKADAHAVARFTRVVFLSAPDADALRTMLAAGQDVVVTMTIPDSFVAKGRAGTRYIPHYETVENQEVGHAMLLAGYATLPHGTYFLLHNSWGTGWGDGGYAWVHEATVAKWTREYLMIDAEPSFGGAAQARPVRGRGETTCAAGLVPDSIRGTCATRCPDGSPRHDDVCAAAKSPCPAGYVNLTGACVIAAPSTQGTDAKTGIAWQCGPGGCTYVLPRTVDPQCTGSTCMTSCPAPDYRVARDGSALTCIE